MDGVSVCMGRVMTFFGLSLGWVFVVGARSHLLASGFLAGYIYSVYVGLCCALAGAAADARLAFSPNVRFTIAVISLENRRSNFCLSLSKLQF